MVLRKGLAIFVIVFSDRSQHFAARRKNRRGPTGVNSQWQCNGGQCRELIAGSHIRDQAVDGTAIIGGQIRPDSLFDSSGLRRLIERNLNFRRLEEARIPVHVVATNLGGVTVCFSKGPAADAILASAAIPVAYPSVRIGDDHLIDGAIGGNTPILTAAELGASRIIVLPTGFACSLAAPPSGAAARGLHAITLLVAHQMVRDLKVLAGKVTVHTVPSLCPLNVSPFNFDHAAELIERASASTRQWLEGGGLAQQTIPDALCAHTHSAEP